MKKLYLKYILFFVVAIFWIVPTNSFAITSEGGYTIESYDIDMVVNENNTFDITERITANFSEPKHGIFREIPLRNKITRTDGTTSSNRAKITNIRVSEDYETYKEYGYKVIKIGNSEKTLTGEQSYVIKYTYDIGNDPLENADELYYNLIGDKWDTIIKRVTFKITMPKEFDKSLLGFSSGEKGSTNNSNVFYTVDGNVISGTLYDDLKPREALTVRLTLPEGYFIKSEEKIDQYSTNVIIFSIACVLITYMCWRKYGKDDMAVETVEFYPPEGYNSAEIAFFYKGNADNSGAISLLIYLANKGYLKIEEIEEQDENGKSKEFRITKLKEYDGNNENEKKFFEGLFEVNNGVNYEKAKKLREEAKEKGEKLSYTDSLIQSQKISKRTSVTKSDLYDKFYRTIDGIKNNLVSKENINKIFEVSANKKIKWIKLMVIAIFILITGKPISEYLDSSEVLSLIFVTIFQGAALSIIVALMFGKMSILEKIIILIFFVPLFIVIPMIFSVLPFLFDYPMYTITYGIGFICATLLIVFENIMPKRTHFGNEMLGKIGGFKRFLETAEKPQLESLVEKNPEYFYNILPYTYALDVSDVWIKKFETIALRAPDWYDSRKEFNMNNFRKVYV